jgi:hypothetical protein
VSDGMHELATRAAKDSVTALRELVLPHHGAR